MSTYSKNLFDVLAENDNTPVKVEAPAPVVVDKKNVSKLNKEASKDEKKSRRPAKGERPTKDGRPRRGRQFDRHSGTGIVNQGWGKPGKDEGERAKDTLNPADPDAPEQDAPATPAEPEEVVKTLDEYLAEKASKALNVALPEARKANDADESAFAGAVVHQKKEIEEFFVSTKETKTVSKKTEKSRKEKVIVDIEQRFQEKPRNDFRKNDRRGNRNNNRKSNKTNIAAVNLQDAAAFPSLGASA
ncbi:hypothetical protein G6F54_010970 [Rhizopus delemar]|nr:hypothetical protein G6F54_010970 [Rhizopus delemar]